jgi:hypothetical protein
VSIRTGIATSEIFPLKTISLLHRPGIRIRMRIRMRGRNRNLDPLPDAQPRAPGDGAEHRRRPESDPGRSASALHPPCHFARAGAYTWKTSTTAWSPSNPCSIAFPTGAPTCQAPAKTTGPSRSVGTIEADARSAVPNSSRPSSNKPAKPWHPNAPAPNHIQPVRYTVPGIAVMGYLQDVMYAVFAGAKNDDWCTFICDTESMKKRVQVVD